MPFSIIGYKFDRVILELSELKPEMDFEINFAPAGILNIHSLDDIPEYFYANSIAILFPYIRVFVSTVTLQANIKPIVLQHITITSTRNSY